MTNKIENVNDEGYLVREAVICLFDMINELENIEKMNKSGRQRYRVASLRLVKINKSLRKVMVQNETDKEKERIQKTKRFLHNVWGDIGTNSGNLVGKLFSWSKK